MKPYSSIYESMTYCHKCPICNCFLTNPKKEITIRVNNYEYIIDTTTNKLIEIECVLKISDVYDTMAYGCPRISDWFHDEFVLCYKCKRYIFSVFIDVSCIDNIRSRIRSETASILKDNKNHQIYNDYNSNKTIYNGNEKFPLLSDNLFEPNKVLEKILKLINFL